MVDNLKRVKGILKANSGLKVPSYSYLYDNRPVISKVAEDGTTIYSRDNMLWFIDPETTQIYKPKGKMEIPGEQKLSPNISAENAAKEVQQTQAVVAEQKAQTAATVQQVATVATAPRSIEKVPEAPSINAAPAQALKTNDNLAGTVQSAGMNFVSEEAAAQAEQKLKDQKIMSNVGQVGNQVIQGIGDAFGAKQAATDSNLTKGADQAYDAIAGVASNFGPWGKVVSGAMKTAGAVGDIIQEMGGGTDQQTKMDKWMDSSFFSWNIGMLNGFAGKNSNSFAVDQDVLAQVGGSYGGTASDIADASEKAGKKYGLFSSKARKKANAAIATAKSQQNLMGDIADTATDQRLLTQSMGEQAGLAYSMMTDGGYSQKYTYAAKHGGLLNWNPVIELEWQPQVELNWELPEFKEGGSIELNETLEWIPEFKDGGKTKSDDIPEIEETNQKNVIPEGALHKNKHHMEHAEGLTKKGIPVIDEDGEQQAEIEHSEIIFTLEVTKKLEEYYEIFYDNDSTNKEKEQAALDAGKLLVYQILENTDDRTGLIDSCKKGGTLTLKKSTDDLIEEALEWIPTIVVIEESEKEEDKPKKKTEKEQMKEALKEILIELLTE